MTLVEFLQSKLGIAACGLALCLLVGGVQQARVLRWELAASQAQTDYEKEAGKARALRGTVTTLTNANHDLEASITQQNARIESLAAEAQMATSRANEVAAKVERAAAARRAARPPGTGPAYLYARMAEIRDAVR